MRDRSAVLLLGLIAVAQAVFLYFNTLSQANQAVARLANLAVMLGQQEGSGLSMQQQHTLIVLADSDVLWLSKLPLCIFPREVSRAFDVAKATFAEPRRRYARIYGEVPKYVSELERSAYLKSWRETQVLLERAEAEAKGR